MRYLILSGALLWAAHVSAMPAQDMQQLQADITHIEQQIEIAKADKDKATLSQLRKAKTELQKQLNALKREDKHQQKQASKRAAAEQAWAGYPPEQQLCAAIEYNRLDLVKQVVESGAIDLSKANSVCYFPLGDAGARGHIEIVRYLLEKKSPLAMPFPHLNTVFTAIDLTAGNKEDRTAILNVLKDHQTPLDSRSENNMSVMVQTNNAEESAYLAQKFNLREGDLATGSSLIKAMKQGNLQNLQWLLQQGANPNEISLGKSALFFAIDSHDLEKVKLLVKHGADVNQAAVGFITPLQYAQKKLPKASQKRKAQFEAIIAFLVAQGAK